MRDDVGVLLRRATLPDLPGLLDVQETGAIRALASVFPQDDYPFPRADLERRWASEIENPDVDVQVVVRDEGSVDGFVAIRGDELLHFGTAVETWGSGLAATVHAEIIELLAAGGTTLAWLRVFEQNPRARRFYEKMGWRPTQRRSLSSFAPYPVLVAYECDL